MTPCVWQGFGSTLVYVRFLDGTKPSPEPMLTNIDCCNVMNNDNFVESEIFNTVRKFFLVLCDTFHLHIANWPFVLCRPSGHRCILSYVREMLISCMCYCVCGWFGGTVFTIFLYFLHLLAEFHRLIICSNLIVLFWGPTFIADSVLLVLLHLIPHIIFLKYGATQCLVTIFLNMELPNAL